MDKKKSGKISKKRKMALGKGLEALIPGGEALKEQDEKKYFMCDIDLIHPNRYQPRQTFSEDDLEELSHSIKKQGVIQPLIVRENRYGYELITGERRLRASKMAGLKKIPVIVKEVSDSNLLEMALVENIQRANLNPIEESDAYYRLMEDFGLTQEEISDRVGKSRSSVANYLRLRHLSEEVRLSIMDGAISMGHAKALMGADNSRQLTQAWQKIIAKKLSVREAEKLISRLKKANEKPEKPEPDSGDIYLASVAERLSRRFGTKVNIKRRGKKGKVEIEFYNDDDLDRLLGLLGTDD